MSVLWLIISVCEWWFAAAVCSYKTVSFFLLSRLVLFSYWVNVRGCCQLAWLPEAASDCPVRSANTPVSSRVGGPAARSHWEPPSAQQPNNGAELGSEDVKQTHCKWHFYLLAFTSPPPTTFIYWDPQCHFQEPHGNGRPCQRGDNFLMMSPCHGDRRPVAERWSSFWDVGIPMEHTKVGFWY